MASHAYAKDAGVSHAGVAVQNWAGDFDCSVCRRKRLTASEFSKKMQEKKRAGKTDLKCKQCVTAAEKVERAAAVAKTATSSTTASSAVATADSLPCGACGTARPESAYSKPQLKKGDKRRCGACIESADAADAASKDQKANATLKDAQRAAKLADATGSVVEKLRANAALAAAEAELVTGLKPICLGRGRGRSRGGGRAAGRGRSTAT